MTMTMTTTCCMVSNDWMKNENGDKESKKGKRTFGYAGARDLEQGRLQEGEVAQNVNQGGGRKGGSVLHIDQEVMGEYVEVEYSPKL